MRNTNKEFATKVMSKVANLPNEEWRPAQYISGKTYEMIHFPQYEVSSLGRAKTIAHEFWYLKGGDKFFREKLLTVNHSPEGYPYITMYKDGKKYGLHLNRLVASTFIPNPNPALYTDANHRNPDDLDDCRVQSVEWTTKIENNNYGNRGAKLSKKLKGKKKSTEAIEKSAAKRKKPIICDGIRFDSLKECAAYFGVHGSAMCNWLKGKKPMPEEFARRGLSYATA